MYVVYWVRGDHVRNAGGNGGGLLKCPDELDRKNAMGKTGKAGTEEWMTSVRYFGIHQPWAD